MPGPVDLVPYGMQTKSHAKMITPRPSQPCLHCLLCILNPLTATTRESGYKLYIRYRYIIYNLHSHTQADSIFLLFFLVIK